jgi:hypothetical protein
MVLTSISKREISQVFSLKTPVRKIIEITNEIFAFEREQVDDISNMILVEVWLTASKKGFFGKEYQEHVANPYLIMLDKRKTVHQAHIQIYSHFRQLIVNDKKKINEQ